MKTITFNKSYNIPLTLFCGQTFSWQETPKGYVGCIDNRPALIKPVSNGYQLITKKENHVFFESYFDIYRDYDAIYRGFLSDEIFCSAYKQWPGIRILNQPVWETLCSFIISANNNIKRITGIVERLCKKYGNRQEIEGAVTYAFPTPLALSSASLEDLKELGLGYRAPYINKTALKIAEGFNLNALKDMGYGNALKELVSLNGVGEKVADCVLLFSCGYLNAFPLDTWMIRVMQNAYQIKGTKAQMKEQAMKMFGQYAGIAQQVLFYAAKENNGLNMPVL